MTYPNSSDVSAGQPTASAHYNNLRKDAVFLGNVSADSVSLGKLLSTYISNIDIKYLATNRIRVPYVTTDPGTLVIDGCMLQQTDNVDLPSGQFSGAAATWYIFANRSSSSTSFTLSVNTSPSSAAGQRLIGQVFWNGTTLDQSSIITYSALRSPDPDYDSGWFAVAYAQSYYKTHYLGTVPRQVLLLHCTSYDGSGYNNVMGTVGDGSSIKSNLAISSSGIHVNTGNEPSTGTCYTMLTVSSSGYYRILAWI